MPARVKGSHEAGPGGAERQPPCPCGAPAISQALFLACEMHRWLVFVLFLVPSSRSLHSRRERQTNSIANPTYIVRSKISAADKEIRLLFKRSLFRKQGL